VGIPRESKRIKGAERIKGAVFEYFGDSASKAIAPGTFTDQQVFLRLPELAANYPNILWSAWIVLGSYREEKDVVAESGESYRRYQETVPMLLPWRGPIGRGLRNPEDLL
jgi:hypothetical protein